jgi:hypothetical protein
MELKLDTRTFNLPFWISSKPTWVGIVNFIENIKSYCLISKIAFLCSSRYRPKICKNFVIITSVAIVTNSAYNYVFRKWTIYSLQKLPSVIRLHRSMLNVTSSTTWTTFPVFNDKSSKRYTFLCYWDKIL